MKRNAVRIHGGLRRGVRSDTACRSTRRKFLVAAIAAALPIRSAIAQTVQKIPRLAILQLASGKSVQAGEATFLRGLNDLGYVEGKSIAIERRYADGHADRLPALAAELVRGKPDVILAPTTPAAHAAKEATSSIPIVIVQASDPVGSGFAASLARPGGNVTGTSNIQTEIDAKRVEMLKEVFPKIARVAVVHAGDRLAQLQMAAVQKGGRALGVDVVSMEASRPEHYRKEIAGARSRSIDAILITSNAQNGEHRQLIVELAAEHRVPAIYPNTLWSDIGGLMGFGTDGRALQYRAATYVDKILKGAKPGDLPIELPTRFELVINMKTAKALGVTIPPTVLVRADRVVE